MKLNSLQPASNSVKDDKRIGRGTGSGRGGTSTRGHKGAKSRSGYKKKIGFEGGQMPLQRRVPKFGFKNPGRVSYKAINLFVLEQLAADFNLSKISFSDLREHGFASKNDKIKVLGNGEITTALEVEVHSFSSSAQDAIEKAGGKVTKL